MFHEDAALLVGGVVVDRRHGDALQPEVHPQLGAVVDDVVEDELAQDEPADFLEPDLALRLERPGRQQVRIRRRRERRAELAGVLVELRQQFLDRVRQRRPLTSGGRRRVELVALDRPSRPTTAPA